LFRGIAALFFGAVIGFIGVVLHNAFQPVGILLALLTTAIGINFAGQLFGARRYKLIAAIAWLAVALRAGTYGMSSEILIISNLYGNIFLLGGLLVAFIAVLRKR
jgi:ABC-type transport system involved in cytochrome c biogenesis permease subunit